MSPKDINPIQAVAFDLYGTLVQPGIMHHPFRKILKWARQEGRRPTDDDAQRLLTTNKEGASLLGTLGICPSVTMLEQLQNDIYEELASQQLFDDVFPTLDTLSKSGIPIAICSNLAKPYGVIIERLLRPHFDLIYCLSYEEGIIKPENGMYERVVKNIGIPAENTLFIGDTHLLDYERPRCYGFQALHLVRGGISKGGVITSLKEVPFKM